MASIYDKALKRKDFSGVTNKDKEEVATTDSKSKFFSEFPSFFSSHMVDKTKAQKKEEEDKAAKADDPKAGAGVGKIVNLIAGDSNRVRNITYFSRLLSSNFTFRSLKRHLRSIFSMEVHMIQFLWIRLHRINTPFQLLSKF